MEHKARDHRSTPETTFSVETDMNLCTNLVLQEGGR